ncbi:MAG: large conductance mechanosensitive channel protein MscL [Oscillospiraceae bacterium]|nr:large conductance mechanosensitive channel protein MscL [Oscillospiraceae bacterium]
MKRFLQEFKEFALRGNVVSLAVGMMIGLVFQDVISSLSENILSPIIGLFVRQNFDALEWSIFGVTLRYGAFITSVLNFFILALVVFLIVRAMNKLLSANEQKQEEPEPEHTCPFCMTTLHKSATRCPACTSALNTIN